MKIIIDTSAWIEYFLGSKFGEIVNEHLKNDETVTSIVSLLEISYKADKEGWNIKDYLNFIKMKSQIIGIKESSVMDFGKMYNQARKKEKDFGFADAVILSTAKSEKAGILTKDNHFRSFDNVIML